MPKSVAVMPGSLGGSICGTPDLPSRLSLTARAEDMRVRPRSGAYNARSFFRRLLIAQSASRVWVLISLCIALLMAAFCLAIGEALL